MCTKCTRKNIQKIENVIKNHQKLTRYAPPSKFVSGTYPPIFRRAAAEFFFTAYFPPRSGGFFFYRLFSAAQRRKIFVMFGSCFVTIFVMLCARLRMFCLKYCPKMQTIGTRYHQKLTRYAMNIHGYRLDADTLLQVGAPHPLIGSS